MIGRCLSTSGPAPLSTRAMRAQGTAAGQGAPLSTSVSSSAAQSKRQRGQWREYPAAGDDPTVLHYDLGVKLVFKLRSQAEQKEEEKLNKNLMT